MFINFAYYSHLCRQLFTTATFCDIFLFPKPSIHTMHQKTDLSLFSFQKVMLIPAKPQLSTVHTFQHYHSTKISHIIFQGPFFFKQKNGLWDIFGGQMKVKFVGGIMSIFHGSLPYFDHLVYFFIRLHVISLMQCLFYAEKNVLTV